MGVMSRRGVGLIVALALAAFATAAWMSYVRSVEHRALNGAATVPVLVAKDTIPVGTSVEVAEQRGLFDKQQIPRKLVADGAVDSTTSLRGAFASSTIAKGEQIVRSRFVTQAQSGHLLSIPQGLQAMSIQVDTPNGVGGFVQPHDRVSVLATIQTPQGPRTQFIFQGIEVLAVGQSVAPTKPAADSKNGVTVNQDKLLLTLALSGAQAEQLEFAVVEGNVAFTLLPSGAKPQGTSGRTTDNFYH